MIIPMKEKKILRSFRLPANLDLLHQGLVLTKSTTDLRSEWNSILFPAPPASYSEQLQCIRMDVVHAITRECVVAGGS